MYPYANLGHSVCLIRSEMFLLSPFIFFKLHPTKENNWIRLNLIRCIRIGFFILELVRESLSFPQRVD